MVTVILGVVIMLTAILLLTMALKMRDKSLSHDCCSGEKDGNGEHHATCANCTCGKVFDKRKKIDFHISGEEGRR